MPWRVLGVRKATSLVVAEQGPPEWLLARLGEREAAALPVLRRSGGLLLAISAGAITPEQIAAGNIAGITGDLGPTTTVMIEGFLEDADADSIDVEMVLVDWPAPLYKHLRAGGVNWPANTVWPHNGDEIVKAVNTDQLATLAREWVQQDEVAISEAYATAVEAPAEAAPNPTEGLLNQLLEQMQATAASVANLRADVDVMKQAPPPPNTGPVDALAQAQQLVGPAPRTRAAVQDVALAAPRGSGALDGEGLEEVAEVGAAGDISTDTLLKTALVKLLEGQTKKKKTKAPGLPLAQALSDSDDEEDSADPLRKLSGARGTMLAERLRLSMESCPQDYIAAIEALAAQMVGDHVPGPATMEKYVKEQLPMGSERGLGMGISQGSDSHTCGREGQVPSDFASVGSRSRAVSDRRSVDLCMALDQPDASTVCGVEQQGLIHRRDPHKSCACPDHSQHMGSHSSRAAEGRGGVDEAQTKAVLRGQATERGQRRTRPGKARGRRPVSHWSDLPGCMYSLFCKSRSDFASFLRSAHRRDCSSSSAELLPLPIPFAWRQAPSLRGSRRRCRRYRERRALELMVNLEVVALNFSYLGGPRRCPASGCRGELRDGQWQIVESLLDRTRSWRRLVGDLSTGSGSKILDAQSELVQLEARLDDLAELVYGASKQASREANSGGTTDVVPTVASAVAFPQELSDFSPEPFLPEPFLTAFTSPATLLGDRCPGPPPVINASEKGELWHLCWRWDKVGRLCLALPEEVDQADRCNLFCLAKPDGELRQIIDRRPRNQAEADPPKDGPKMGHASVFLNLVVPAQGCIRGSVDDLRNFYHAFKVSTERALSTPVGPSWYAGDFAGSDALAALRRRFPGRAIGHGTQVFTCFAGLSMGDKWAPSIAQVSHEAVLKAFGALDEHEHLKLGYPVPRAPLGHYSGVCIDDKLSLQVFKRFVPIGTPAEVTPARDLQACEQADTAYRAVGLEAHPKKKVRRAANFKVWGAQFQGNKGLVSMDCTRLAALCLLTAQVASVGACSERLLHKILGLWAFAFQFRRPLFSLFDKAYKVGHPEGDFLAPFRLPWDLIQELQLASCLGGLASTSLKAQVSSTLFGTDASPEGAGIVACHVGTPIAQELFRRTDGRGFHARLLSEVGAYLHVAGYGSDEPDFLIRTANEDDPRPTGLTEVELTLPSMCHTSLQLDAEALELLHKFALASLRVRDMSTEGFRLDFLEVYSGSASISASMLESGFTVGPPLDLNTGWDLRQAQLFMFLVKLCEAGRVGMLWIAPPCTTFSLARCPKLRSMHEPWGFDPLDLETCEGNLHMHQALALFTLQLLKGNEAIVETPWGAFSRHLPWWKASVLRGCEVRVDQCRFGTPYMKPTALLCSSKQLAPLGRRCRCRSAHERLEGARTAQAAAYPLAFCQEVAKVIEAVAKVRHAVAGVQQTAGGLEHEPEVGDVRDHRGAQRFVSHLWAAQLAESLPWRTIRAYRFKRSNHINVLECHVYKTLLLLAPMNHRLVILQDSMVTLGAAAKGRSSSRALNKILRQAMSIQIAKNIYPSGVHCPTWALRADDPSRKRRVRPARTALPRWFLALKQGRLVQAQDELDDISGAPRSWNRWALFTGVALLAASGGFGSFSEWATSAHAAPGPSGSRARPSDSCHSKLEGTTLGGISRVGDGRRTAKPSSGRDCSAEADSAGTSFRRIWTHPVRAGRSSEGLCGDHQHSGAEISFCKELHGGPLEAVDHVGDFVARKNSPTHAAGAHESLCDNCPDLGLEAYGSESVARLLRLASLLRGHCTESQRLSHVVRERVQKRRFPASDAGQIEDSRSQDAKRQGRRALCHQFYAELFQDYGTLRKDMASLFKPFPCETPAVAQRGSQ